MPNHHYGTHVPNSAFVVGKLNSSARLARAYWPRDVRANVYAHRGRGPRDQYRYLQCDGEPVPPRVQWRPDGRHDLGSTGILRRTMQLRGQAILVTNRVPPAQPAQARAPQPAAVARQQIRVPRNVSTPMLRVLPKVLQAVMHGSTKLPETAPGRPPEPECVVCNGDNGEPCVANFPCGHVTYCLDCAKEAATHEDIACRCAYCGLPSLTVAIRYP